MDLTPVARERYDAVVAARDKLVVGLDYDGTLAPIVPDPAAAVIQAEAPDALVALAPRVRAVVVVTGRPAAQAVRLGGLDAVADRLGAGGLLVVLGQYGHERWDSASRAVTSPEPPPGLAALAEELPGLLAAYDAADAFVEDKGLALAVHTRRLPDPDGALQRLRPALADAARRHGLELEPGRMVLELRAPGMHKGDAVRAAVAELEAGGLVFAGDDLGDVEAFRAVADLRGHGLPGLLVCSGSQEQQALVELADVVVDGPDGVVALLRRLTSDLTR